MAACLKSLGYSNAAVIFKYVFFAFACSLIGGALGIITGNYVLSRILFDAAKVKFDIPNSPYSVYISLGLIWSAVMTAAVTLTAFAVSFVRCREKPAALLRPKAPKAGQKIFFERIPFFWKRLKFKYKSSVRNVVRYKGRLIMTVLSVAGSAALVFCGLALFSSLDNLRDHPGQEAGLADSVMPISAAIVLCAVALSVLVLFNLTNINIEERKREIATLKVLGYNNIEVAGYIYREVMMLSVVGIILGLPAGYLLMGFIFKFLDFGSLKMVEWYDWAAAAAISLFSVLITDVLLYRKIAKTQMHTSLKTVE